MPSNHLILCHPLLLLPSIFPSISVFSNESVLHIRWPKYWSFSFNISPSNEHPGLISFRMDWLDLLTVRGTLKSLLQHPQLSFIEWVLCVSAVVPLLCLISLHSTNSQCKLSRNPVFIPFTKICHDSYCFFSLLYIISYFLVSLMSNIFMVSTSGRGRYNNLFVSYAIFNHPFPGWISTLDSVFSWLYLMQENSMALVFRGFFFLFFLPNYWPFPVSCLSLNKLVILTLEQFPWIPSYSKLFSLSSFWFLCCFVHAFLSFSSI